MSRRFQESDVLAHELVGLVHGLFEFAVGLAVGVGAVVKEAVGKRAG